MFSFFLGQDVRIQFNCPKAYFGPKGVDCEAFGVNCGQQKRFEVNQLSSLYLPVWCGFFCGVFLVVVFFGDFFFLMGLCWVF